MPVSFAPRRMPDVGKIVPTSCSALSALSVKSGPEWQGEQPARSKILRPARASLVKLPSGIAKRASPDRGERRDVRRERVELDADAGHGLAECVELRRRGPCARRSRRPT